MRLYACCVLCYAIAAGCVYAEVFDRIVAVVNDEPITQSELDSLLMPIYEQYKTAYAGSEFNAKITEARSNLLSQMIEDRLVAQEAKRLGVTVSEQEVEQQMKTVQDKFGTKEEFAVVLAQQGMSVEKVRKRFEEQIAIQKLHSYEVRQKVVVSPLEIEQYYNAHSADYTDPAKTKVRTIMIKKKKSSADSAVDEAREKIEAIEQELKNGMSFADAAKQYSEGMKAADGGDVGFIKRGDLIADFDDILFSLAVGERTRILETEVGYHLFVVEAKQEQKVIPMTEVKDDIEAIIFREKAKERFSKWMEELKAGAYISIK
jgi:parvulin-like peptidyl-prolyl isomerase